MVIIMKNVILGLEPYSGQAIFLNMAETSDSVPLYSLPNNSKSIIYYENLSFKRKYPENVQNFHSIHVLKNPLFSTHATFKPYLTKEAETHNAFREYIHLMATIGPKI